MNGDRSPALKRARTDPDSNLDSRSPTPTKEMSHHRDSSDEKISLTADHSPTISPNLCSDPDSPKSDTHSSEVVAKISLAEPVMSPFSIMQHSIKNRRAPLETLCRIFPHMKRTVLQLILQGCNNDIVQSIEQVLNNHHHHHHHHHLLHSHHGSSSQAQGQGHAGAGDHQIVDRTSVYSSSSSTDPGSMTVSTPSYLSPSISGSIISGGSVNSGGTFKSAFSPIASLGNPTAAHSALGSVRYTYGASGRGLAFAMPYPPVLPTFAMGSAAYSYTGLTGPANKAFHYAMCPCCTVKPYAQTTTEKTTTGCLGES